MGIFEADVKGIREALRSEAILGGTIMESNVQIELHWKRIIFGSCLIILATFVSYSAAIRGGFIWNDDTFLTENPAIKAGNGLYDIWLTTRLPDYFPLTSTSLWLEWRLWGKNATGYHIVNVLLHALSAVLIWLILKRLKIPGAWVAGLVFAIHPVNVESVAWITERKNVLPMVFYLLSVLWYLKFDCDGKRSFYGLALGAFLLAMLSKTSVAMQPIVLLGCVWWKRGKVGRKDIFNTIPFFFLSVILSLVTIWFQYHRAIGPEIVREDSFLSRLAIAGMAVWFYLFKAFIPFKLTFIYPMWKIDASSFVNYLPGFLLLIIFILFWHYRNSWGRPFLFGLGYYVLTLFPVLGFFNIYFMKYSLVADHWQYASIAGVIALVVGLITYGYNRVQKIFRQLFAIAGAVLIGLFSLLTWRQGHIYTDLETLWQDTIKKNPTAWLAHYNLANLMLRQDRGEDAIHHYSETIKIKADYAEAYNNLGTALLGKGEIEGAIKCFSKALNIKPDHAKACNNFGIALARKGDRQGAIKQFSKALQIQPDYAKARQNLDYMLRLKSKPEK